MVKSGLGIFLFTLIMCYVGFCLWEKKKKKKHLACKLNNGNKEQNMSFASTFINFAVHAENLNNYKSVITRND